MKKFDKVKKQSEFCLELMKRLNENVQTASIEYGYINKHTRMENAVIRLRNELNDLRDMLHQYGYE